MALLGRGKPFLPHLPRFTFPRAPVVGSCAATTSATATATVAVSVVGTCASIASGTGTATVPTLFTITDKLYDGLQGNPVVGFTVFLAPATLPVLMIQGDGLLHQIGPPFPSCPTDGTGSFTLQGPRMTSQLPSTTPWKLGPMPDGTIWQGPPPGGGTYAIPALIAAGWYKAN